MLLLLDISFVHDVFQFTQPTGYLEIDVPSLLPRDRDICLNFTFLLREPNIDLQVCHSARPSALFKDINIACISIHRFSCNPSKPSRPAFPVTVIKKIPTRMP
jgi:hypothetical protein